MNNTPAGRAKSAEPLFSNDVCEDMRRQWGDIQTGFVDQPRRAAEDADALVANTIKRLTDTFASERAKLEGQWDRGGDASTEDLRVAFQRYRSFFYRLLAI
jgi:hypothetical protein